jgi:molybdopterin biosynthesis enzyme MoaB
MLIRTAFLCVPAPDDEAVQAVQQRLRQTVAGIHVWAERSAPNQRHWVEELLRQWCDEEEVDLVITIGGTLPAPGPSGQEIVPEATLAVVERLLPGLPEEMRAVGRDHSPLALLERGVAGIRGRSLILNLPGEAGPATLFLGAVVKLLEPILAHLQEQSDAPKLVVAPPGATPLVENEEPTPTAPLRPSKLNAAEFASFLQRKAS